MNPCFQLISRVATSGFSTVDHARDLRTGIEVAIKRPRPSQPEATAQWQREQDVLSRLHNENIVSLIEAGSDEAGPFLALEWIEGAAFPGRGQDFAKMIKLVLRALSVVHAADFAHADINATNVLICHDGCLKLIDFGNVWPLGDTQTRAIHDANIGSVHHMAPELFSGAPPSVRSDFYALGVMAYHALAGRFPFEGDTPAQVITAHLRFDAKPLPFSPLGSWIHRLLSRDRAARPASAIEALETLPFA